RRGSGSVTAPALHTRRKRAAARRARHETYGVACAAAELVGALRSYAPPLVGGRRRPETNERKIWPHRSTSWRRLRRCVGAPSVALPENVIPSAGATRASFQSTSTIAVLLPESFRGGCSFGGGSPLSPPASVVCTFFSLSPLPGFCPAVAVGRLVSVAGAGPQNFPPSP